MTVGAPEIFSLQMRGFYMVRCAVKHHEIGEQAMSQNGYGDREELLEKLRSTLVAGEVPTSALKTRREELRISQHELARMSSVSQSVISRIEAGNRLPTDAQIEKLGVALKVGEQDLGLAEIMTMMGRLAAKGELPPEATADFAARLMARQPDSDAAQRLVVRCTE